MKKITAPVVELKHGEWRNPKADRGVFLRKRVWYIRFAVESGKPLKVERSGFSKADAHWLGSGRFRWVHACHERHCFPVLHHSWLPAVDREDERQG